MDDIFTGISKVYVGDTPLNPTIQFDGEVMENKSETTEYKNISEPKEYKLTFEMAADVQVKKWFLNERRRFKRKKKLLLWAVTHGYIIGLEGKYDRLDGWLLLYKPSQVRTVLRMLHFIPKFIIIDKEYKQIKERS